MRLQNLQLGFLASLVLASIGLIIVGASISAWCIKTGTQYECHSLFKSNAIFSCLYKLIPIIIVICLCLSFIIFLIAIFISTNKEYQIVIRFANAVVLSIAIILILIILLQWLHQPSDTSKSILIVSVLDNNQTQPSEAIFETIYPNNPLYLEALKVQRQPFIRSNYNINHGPNLFSATFILLLVILVAFLIVYRGTD